MATDILLTLACLLVVGGVFYLAYMVNHHRTRAARCRVALAEARREANQAREEAKALQVSNDAIAATATDLCNEVAKVQRSWEAAAQQHAGQTALLAMVNGARETWKSYALALEVVCECCADCDEVGAENAHLAVLEAREVLRLLGEYDD